MRIPNCLTSQRGGRRKSLCQHLSRPATASVCPFSRESLLLIRADRLGRCSLGAFGTSPGHRMNFLPVEYASAGPAPPLAADGGNEFTHVDAPTLSVRPASRMRLRPARHLLVRPMAGMNFIHVKFASDCSHSEIPWDTPSQIRSWIRISSPDTIALHSFRHCCFGSTGLTI